MGLPQRIAYQDQRYPYIVLAPIGKKNKYIRSIGHKFERGLLSRLNDAIMDQIDAKGLDVTPIRRYLGLEENAVLPVSFRKDEIHDHLLRPELFLWKSLPEEHGLPLKDEYQYGTDYTQLSSEQLNDHIGEVLEDYLFLSHISSEEREHWLKKIAAAFQQHPLVRLYHQKQQVIDAVETMNQSSLLSVLNYPEDVAYWRHRVEIVMRPFRSLPDSWVRGKEDSCSHDKVLTFHSSSRTIRCECETCDFRLYYDVDVDIVRLSEEYDVERAAKRTATIERQFNEVAQQNPRLLDQLAQLKALKKQLATARKTLDESLQVFKQIERYQRKQEHLTSYPLLDMYDKLSRTYIPDCLESSELLWMSEVELHDIRILKQLKEWKKLVPEHVYPFTSHVLEELKVKLEEVRYADDDIILTVKGRPLTFADTQQILDLIYYYGTDHPAHTLVQVLAGKATNKLRTLQLHETRWFGQLSHWPEKHIQKIFNQLEKQGWLMKQQKGYSVSDYAEEVM
ncbi:RQC-minor-2 family DNA-binding protein [Halobacillus sp. ACCC02827]|uniref:RQC-minor-2 family DNA-binding protein n=1 Tax=Halobacillus sp. ACCC02827 TaxID=3052090 RepID=UPI00257031E8|nr:RQC-minor-2 family DNA-binding protein [Halobacillus sp. ACCC02827]WJE15519.1 RQC-minor-2 family DNA-binding protein [Halobacillus sp. ACCC02827]